jgi:signal recognition particle receptor subunit beta
VLDGADGIIFIGDSVPEKLEQNKRSFRELISFVSSKNIPYLVQLNKRDLKKVVSVKEFKIALGLPLLDNYPDGTKVLYLSEAIQGKNVVECFKQIIIQVIFNYFKE